MTDIELAARLMPGAVIFGVPDEVELEKLRQEIVKAIATVRDQEREECAKLAETVNVLGGPNGQPIAAAIRNRSQ